MSRNGSGGYTPPSNSWFPAVNGVSAATADWNATLTDIASAIQQSISADGQTPITGNLQMGGNKLTGLAAGSGTGQSLRYEQLFSQGSLTDIASAATVDIGAQLTNFLRVTGTTGIASFGTNYNGPRFLIFAGAVLLTHSATLVLPTGANITTAAGDSLIAIPVSGGWQVVAYQRASGLALSGGGDFLNTTRIDVASATTVDLTASAPSTRNINITGTTTITGFTVAVGLLYFVRFNAALTLTNNASIITQTGASITTSAGDTCIIRATAANTVEVLSYKYAGALPQSQGGTGVNISTRQMGQIVSTQTGAVATGSTVIPYDDTIPQITEGDQYMTLSITPKNASSTLEIEVDANAANAGNGTIIFALFQDSTANALKAVVGQQSGVNLSAFVSFKHTMTAGTTSATTFKLRIGAGGAGTTTFNGVNALRLLGGTYLSGIVIKEYLP